MLTLIVGLLEDLVVGVLEQGFLTPSWHFCCLHHVNIWKADLNGYHRAYGSHSKPSFQMLALMVGSLEECQLEVFLRVLNNMVVNCSICWPLCLV
jgi:hypothetical protein